MEQIHKFPILHNPEKNRKWNIWVTYSEDEASIHRTDGLTTKDFTKKPSIRKIIAKGKNSVKEQAIMEAKKYWIKKLEGGFIPFSEDSVGLKMAEEFNKIKNNQGGSNLGITKTSSTTSTLSETNNSTKVKVENVNNFVQDVKKIKPMLAFDYKLKQNKLIWEKDEKEKLLKKLKDEKKFHNQYFDATEGIFIQPKVDGIRCIVYLDAKTDRVVAFSRNCKQFMFLENQKKEFYNFLKPFYNKGQEIILDGEFYTHKTKLPSGEILEANKNFNFISSCCKIKLNKPNDNEDLINYYVFDVIDNTKNQVERFKILNNLFTSASKGSKLKYIKLCPIKTIDSEDELEKVFEEYYAEGYEGIMLRDPTSLYEDKRSIHLLKYKNSYDEDFVIVGAEEGAGTREGCVIWKCETDKGVGFSCTMGNGCSVEEQQEYFDNYPDYIGSKLVVKYQELSEDGVPRFPVGLKIKNEE